MKHIIQCISEVAFFDRSIDQSARAKHVNLGMSIQIQLTVQTVTRILISDCRECFGSINLHVYVYTCIYCEFCKSLNCNRIKLLRDV